MYGSRLYGAIQYGAGGLSIAHTKSFSETITLIETLIKSPSWFFSEVFTILDTFQSLIVKLIEKNDEATILDSIKKDIAKALNDTETITEAFSKNKRHAETYSDQATMSDTIVRGYADTVLDLITLSDTFRKSPGHKLSDQSTISDTLNTSRGMSKSDTLTVSDIVGRSRVVSLSDLFSISEISYNIYNGVRTLWTKLTRTVTNWVTLERKS